MVRKWVGPNNVCDACDGDGISWARADWYSEFDLVIKDDAEGLPGKVGGR